jgi:hypothetical protein
MKLDRINRTIAIFIALTNIYFIPQNYLIIKNAGGPMGFGLLMLPFLLSTNLFLIPAGLTLRQKSSESVGLLIINCLGLIWNLLLMLGLYLAQKFD